MSNVARSRSRLCSGAIAALLLLFAACTAMPALAQWSWRDAAGNITYSDSPPPPSTPAKDILRQPGMREQLQQYAGTAPATDATAPVRPSGSLADQEADFRKRQLARERTEKKLAEEETQARQRDEACSRARGYQQVLNSGVPVLHPDPDGNHGYLGDEQRVRELQQAHEAIAKNC